MNILVCFAVPQEKQYFRSRSKVRSIVTGMGAKAATACLEESLYQTKPEIIIAAGFAGGLNPALKCGQVVMDNPDQIKHKLNLTSLKNLVHGTIHSAPRVLITPQEKASLRRQTGADAVDMESASIRTVAKRQGIPVLSFRVISDGFEDTLPIDFNLFMTEEGGMRFGALLFHILKRPLVIPKLLTFQRNVHFAARQLGGALDLAIGGGI